VSAIPAAYLLCLTAIRRDIRAAWCFCICELHWRSLECVLLHCFNAQPQCRSSPTLPPQMITGAPLIVIYKKSFRRSATYPTCRHNIGKINPKTKIAELR